MVHLGLGNFHRAHQAVYTADAQDPAESWAITGVATASRDVVAALRAQDMRYTVLSIAPDRVLIDPIDVITDAFTAADEPARVVDLLADPGTALVTLTVTEKGYTFLPGSRRLDLDDPGVAHDLRDPEPRTTVGRLARGLLRRAQGDGAPLTVLSCDNLAANGAFLRGLLTEFAGALPGPDGETLARYLDAVTFPNTMVDRIVPATTDEHRAQAAAAGFDDRVPVPAEPFRMWVMEDRFAAGRPAWERAGAIFTDEVAAYEAIKVRFLNGTHSLLAYLGMLAGHPLIADAVADEPIATAAWRLGDEYRPTVTVPAGFDLDHYRDDLFERFANRPLGHLTRQVGSDGSLKLAQRVPAAVSWHLEHGRAPRALALLVAAWIRAVGEPGSVTAPAVGRATDPAADRLTALTERTSGPEHLARAALADERLLGGGSTADPRFVTAVGDLLGVLRKGGVRAATSDIGSES
ncbi:mannitol dehydrogenase family protein [Actinoallomurus acanthiterrae]